MGDNFRRSLKVLGIFTFSSLPITFVREIGKVGIFADYMTILDRIYPTIKERKEVQ